MSEVPNRAGNRSQVKGGQVRPLTQKQEMIEIADQYIKSKLLRGEL